VCRRGYFGRTGLDRFLQAKEVLTMVSKESPQGVSMKPRRLKVSSLLRDSRSTRPLSRQMLPPMPFLRLNGRWLDAAGFAIGADVRVEVSSGRLVIELLHPPQIQS